jgi:hypothetical protein
MLGAVGTRCALSTSVSRPVLPLAALVLVSGARTILAAPEAVPLNLQAQVLIKTLAYDRALPARAGDAVGIGLLFGSAKDDSLRAQFDLRGAFESRRGTKVLGRPIFVEMHTYKDAATLSAWITDKQIDALYIVPSLLGDVEAIRTVCVERQIASLGATRALVESGVAIGVISKENAPGVLVNLPAALSSGIDLDGRLLRGVEVVRSPVVGRGQSLVVSPAVVSR